MGVPRVAVSRYRIVAQGLEAASEFVNGWMGKVFQLGFVQGCQEFRDEDRSRSCVWSLA